MEHKNWLCFLAWQYGCPVCKVKQLKGGKSGDHGYDEEVEDILRGKLFNSKEKQWIIKQIGWR